MKLSLLVLAGSAAGGLARFWLGAWMVWLTGQFGLDRMRNATVVTPTDEFFPDPYTPDGTHPALPLSV